MSEVPELSPASDGFWWLLDGGQWCFCEIEYLSKKRSRQRGPRLDVTAFNSEGKLWVQFMTMGDIDAHTWGGRIAPPEGLE